LPQISLKQLVKINKMSVKKEAGLYFILLTVLIDVIGFGIIIPIIPQFIMGLLKCDLNTAARWGGWLVFTYSFVQFFAAPIIGSLSDQYGRRPILLASLLAFSIDFVLSGFAPNIGWLFVGRFIAGITGASFSTANAYIADITPPEKRAQNFGMMGAAFGIGFIIGPAIGGLLAKHGERIPFFAAAFLAFLNFLYGYFILPESLSKENRRPFSLKRANAFKSFQNFSKYPIILGLIWSFFFINIAAHANQSAWSYITTKKFNWTPEMIGYSLGWVGFTVALVQGFLSRFIIPKLGQTNSVYVGLLIYAVGFTLFGFATEGWMMYAFMTIFAFGGIAGPSIQSLISSQVKPNEQGEMQGAVTGMISLTSIVGPLLMTNIFAYFSKANSTYYFPGAPFLMGALLCLVSFGFAYRTLSKLKIKL
jgi:MFS transporter, DHA1 family, tetracycline resistance protein